MTILPPLGQPVRHSHPVRQVKALYATSILPLLLLGGCAAFPQMGTPVTRPLPPAQQMTQDAPLASEDQETGLAKDRFSQSFIPGPSAAPASDRTPATAEQIARLLSDDAVDTNLTPQPIPQFIATVFGGVLNVPFTMGPDVVNRTELIAGGSGGPVSKRTLFAVAQRALSQYGIEVYIDGNAVTVGASRQGGAAPTIVRGSTPSSAPGRVVHFYTVQTIEAGAMQTLLSDLYPQLRGTRMTTDVAQNALVISGPGRDVAQVVRALKEIDQPRFSGAEVLRVEPAYWATEALVTALEQVLMTEGYLISRQAMIGRSVVILPFPAANQILIFGRDPDLMDRVRYWVNTLDQPASLGDKASTFVYQVKNTDAQSLGQLAIGQSQSTFSPRAPTGVPGSPPASGRADRDGGNSASQNAIGQGGNFMGGRILVDVVGNRVIFNGTANDFAQLRTLLQTLDTPAPQVVIEVIIAEVTLTDNTSLGVQLFGEDVRGDGSWEAGTGGIDLPGGALSFSFTGPDLRAKLTASAGNSRVNILQRPQLVTRSGSVARFQVGTDVPIITSQRATNTQVGGDSGTDILQSVQYRQTGVILELTPVVYGDRVDIAISQEISEVGKSTNPAIASPPILNRSLTTQIALTDGWTGVLGGLISNNYSKSNSGVPFLKDIPVVGSAFQNNSVTGARTELLMLITPRVIRGDEDMADLADRYADDMNAAFRTGRGWSYTLTPFNVGFGVKGIGLDLPASDRPSDRRIAREARQRQKDEARANRAAADTQDDSLVENDAELADEQITPATAD